MSGHKRIRPVGPRWLQSIAFRELTLLGVIAILVVGLAFWVAFRFVRPAPPDSFVIATGLESGAYQLYGKRYAAILGADDITAAPRTTTGSVENLKLLADDTAGVDVAFVQGGVGNPEEYPNLVTLAALYYEPVWIFYRDEGELTRISQLSGKLVAVGPEGSGSRALAINLIAASSNAPKSVRLSPLSGAPGARALVDGRIGALVMVAAPDAPVIQQLLRAPGIRLMNLSHAEALAKRFPYLSTVRLPHGVVDLKADLPATSITLIATTAYLVARDDFHPALVSVMLQAATAVHGKPSFFSKAGEFPAQRDGDFPMSGDAERYFKSGTPFLQRFMPFWLANLVERLLILLIPIVGVLIPVMRILPAAYNWRVRSRVFRFYRELKDVETELDLGASGERLQQLVKQLDTIESGVNSTRVPTNYADYAYNLKGHIELVRLRLRRLEGLSEK
jgi:TRAP transporter TAXI family solute receptor